MPQGYYNSRTVLLFEGVLLLEISNQIKKFTILKFFGMANIVLSIRIILVQTASQPVAPTKRYKQKKAAER